MSASQKLQTDDNEWFSAMPRSYRNTSGKTTLQKAAEQVALLEMDLNVDKKLVGKERFFELSFRDLCRDTNAVLNDFSTWYAARTGIRLRTRRDLRTDLKENSSIRIGEQEIAEIKRVFDRLGFHLE